MNVAHSSKVSYAAVVQIRLGVADLRIVRFLNFDSAEGEQGPMGLSGKLGVFLREVRAPTENIHSSSPAPGKLNQFFSCNKMAHP